MRTRLFALLLMISTCFCAMAQSSMSTNQIIEYIQKETDKGTSQQQIVINLMKKGVTTSQLQRIRRKVENMRQEMEKDPKRIEKDRSRKPVQEVNYATEEKEKNKNEDEEVNRRALYQESSNDSLYYFIDQMENSERQVFGRNIFNNESLTFQPSGNIATPQNYHLGAGDEVIVDIWGASQLTIRETISPDGVIVVEGVGPIPLGGLSVQQAKNMLKSKLGQYYSDCNFNLSVGETRTIQVQVLGEVNTPGTYTINGLSTTFNALYAAGGISTIGTLRNIKVYRNGRQIAVVDVYDYLINGNSKGDIHLQDNDVIIVGAYDCLVQIQGKVKRPMWYEMKNTETVKQLMQYCGGFTGDAYTKNIRLTRKAGNEYSVHNVDEFKMGSFNLMDEDVLEVDSVRLRYTNTAEIRGAVKHPGKFHIGGEVQTVKDLIKISDGLREDAYIKNAIMHREKDDRSLEMVSIDLEDIMAGTSADLALKNGDVMFIPSKTEMLGELTFTINGEVAYPGIYPYAENAELRDIILQAGGMNEAGSLAKVDVFRRVRDINSPKAGLISAEVFTFSLDEGYNIVQDTAFTLKPYDIVVVRKSPSYEEQQNVYVSGQVNFQGQYSMLTKDYRLTDLIKACGGVTEKAFIGGSHLTRVMTKVEIEQRDQANRQAQINLYESALKSGTEMNMQIADSLLSMKQNTAYTFPVAIDLEKALAHPGSHYDLILRKGDMLEIPEKSDIIKVSGEVMYPVSMVYEKEKNLSFYIEHAGGFSTNAKRSKVYGVNANGSVVRLYSNSVRDIQPGMEIVVPQKTVNKKMSTAEIMGIASGIASVGAIIVSLLNVLKK